MKFLGRPFGRSAIYDRKEKVLNFEKELPSAVTFSRPDITSCATYRDSQGKLSVTDPGVPRFDHNDQGLPLGLLIEGARTNKLAIHNCEPVDLSGLSLAGGQAVLSLEDDNSYLAEAGLDLIGNKKVIRISNTNSQSSIVNFSTVFGSAAQHSFSLWARISSGLPVITRTGSGAQSVTMAQGNSYHRYKLEKISGHAASDRISLVLPAGAEMYF